MLGVRALGARAGSACGLVLRAPARGSPGARGRRRPARCASKARLSRHLPPSCVTLGPVPSRRGQLWERTLRGPARTLGLGPGHRPAGQRRPVRAPRGPAEAERGARGLGVPALAPGAGEAAGLRSTSGGRVGRTGKPLSGMAYQGGRRGTAGRGPSGRRVARLRAGRCAVWPERTLCVGRPGPGRDPGCWDAAAHRAPCRDGVCCSAPPPAAPLLLPSRALSSE
ncbi:translation initiation factor IF-2-like [Meles meles]|uniref:translation initiation factor IF-2-like n=1 Tax=Meles meles TaxID=9662 RepID=UPI001E69B66D|nr:translation initiation factor IF-2-like [Meles meles]